jgi:O-antigen/teichoic acid export membrane protein
VLEMSPAEKDEELPEGLIKQRAKRGVFFLGSYGAITLVLGFVGNIVLARMLLPRDFGIVAIGTTLLMITTALAHGGLANGLIRREQPPSRGELRAALALQLTLTAVLAVAAAAVSFAVGGSGLVVALMITALPVSALEAPGRIVLSRAIDFRPLAAVEALSFFAYYLWAILGVIIGFGVWALASAVVVRALVAGCGVIHVSRLGMLLPSFRDVRALRPVIAFGLRFQAVSLALLGREQGFNIGIAAISGVSTLGLWSLTRRLCQGPLLMFEPLHQVAFPLLSHMRATGQETSRLLDRGVAVAGTASGLVLVSTAAAAPELVPAVFGEQWRPVGAILPWACAALLVWGPVGVVAVGFLYADDAPSVVLKASVLQTIVLFAVALPLLPVLGPEAIGVGLLPGAIADTWFMARAIHARSPARPLRALWPTLAVGALAGAVGTAVTTGMPGGLIAAAAGGLTAAGVYLAVLALVRRAVLIETAGLIVDAVRSGISREPPPAPEAELGQREAVPAATPS